MLIRACLLWLIAVAGMAAPADYGCAERPVRTIYSPYGLSYWRGEDGKAYGVDIELIDALANATGCRFETIELSRILIWKKYEAGETDLVLSALPRADRDRFGRFMPLPYRSNANQLIVSKSLGQPVSLADLDRFPDFRLGVVRGYRYNDDIWDQLVERQQARGELIEVADIESLYRLMKIGRINALLSSPWLYDSMLRRYGLASRVQVLPWSPAKTSLTAGIYLSSQRFTPAELDHWAALLAGPIQQKFTQILRHHLGPEPK